jgi:hypothetical protein
VRCYTVQAGVIERADFSYQWWGNLEIGNGRIPSQKSETNIHIENWQICILRFMLCRKWQVVSHGEEGQISGVRLRTGMAARQ